jgi:hypothetical protein
MGTVIDAPLFGERKSSHTPYMANMLKLPFSRFVVQSQHQTSGRKKFKSRHRQYSTAEAEGSLQWVTVGSILFYAMLPTKGCLCDSCLYWILVPFYIPKFPASPVLHDVKGSTFKSILHRIFSLLVDRVQRNYPWPPGPVYGPEYCKSL